MIVTLFRENVFISKIIWRSKKETHRLEAGEMVQRLRALAACSSRGPEFNSQQPHGSTQTSIIGYDAILW